MQDTNDYLTFAKELAYEAGRIMKQYFNKQPESDIKGDGTIVTIADKEINSMVIERVRAAYPSHAVDGEEESHGQKTQYMWVCDPIDGTAPFAMGLAVSVFSLALVVDGKPMVGVVYDPFCDKLYSAAKGKGAFVNTTPARVSAERLKRGTRLSVEWWSNAPYDVEALLQQLSRETGVYVLKPGSTTHAGALVAEGAFAASVFPGTVGKNVDIAAVKVIVEEAGGKVTDLFGREQRYDQDINGAVVSNGLVHDELVNYLVKSLGNGANK